MTGTVQFFIALKRARDGVSLVKRKKLEDHPRVPDRNPLWIVDSGVRFTLRILQEGYGNMAVIYQGGTAGINLLVPIWDERVFFIVWLAPRRE